MLTTSDTFHVPNFIAEDINGGDLLVTRFLQETCFEQGKVHVL